MRIKSEKADAENRKPLSKIEADGSRRQRQLFQQPPCSASLLFKFSPFRRALRAHA